MRKLLLAALLAGCFSSVAASCLTVPAPSKVVTSLYGWRFHPVLKKWRLHRGLDLRATMSTPLLATHDGLVQVSASGGGGNEIRILGSDGVVTRYLHLTRSLVEPGAKVTAGQEVALSGNTGHASAAPHLHLEVYLKGGSGDVNPEPLLCPTLSRKEGADSVNGFPIKACNPDGGQCGGDGALPPGTGGGGTPGAGSGQASPPGPRFDQFDDMSMAEIYTTEVAKRFSNPDWHRELAEKTAVPLLAESIQMRALGQSIRQRNAELLERIETMMAARLSRINARVSREQTDLHRATAAKAGTE